ncbi:diol dehydratase small subunit [Oscillochloris sp. ZM17-4]|uniref:diol dehydratase small subunit n=1 Tax=Oscillochloris sp. ZM17-4 TaxID=2866714 RepID=UPI001C72C1C7|nr:diol dehydratase small subunit [Oscillochloris sp. ZM17-4]MBX0329806.1 diol dehydratase small subunit [Oscillochloris sp. ZM17-4]
MEHRESRYPLIEHAAETLRAASGRPLSEVTLETLEAGELEIADTQISAEALRAQAEVARAAGYPQLAENLGRAAELTAVPNAEVLRMYDMLRPGRASHAELLALADALEREHAALACAALVREAAEVYARRGLARREPS